MDIRLRISETDQDQKVTREQRQKILDSLARTFRTQRELEDYVLSIGWFAAWFATEGFDDCLTLEERAFAAARLHQQAQFLNAQIEEIYVFVSKRGFHTGQKAFKNKESAVAAWYANNNDDTYAYFDEGLTARALMHLMYHEAAQCIPYIADFVPRGIRQFWFVSHFRQRFFNVIPGDPQFEISQDFIRRLQLINLDRYCDEQYVKTRLAEEKRLSPADISGGNRRMPEQIARLARATNEKYWNKILLQKIKYGAFHCGWPDLTVIMPNNVCFIEVKDKDKMHVSQIVWWLRIAGDAGVNGRIAKIVRSEIHPRMRAA